MTINSLDTYSSMEVQWFVQLEFKVKLHLTYFIISKRFMRVKVKNLPSSNECINIRNRDSRFFSVIYWIPSILSLVAQMVKNLPGMRETWFQSWVGKLPRRMEGPAHSSILAWKAPWTEDLTGYSSWSRRVGYDWATNTNTHLVGQWEQRWERHDLCLLGGRPLTLLRV